MSYINTNRLTLTGIIIGFNLINNNNYVYEIEYIRKSGSVDIIPILITNKNHTQKINIGDFVNVKGEIHTRNDVDKNGDRILETYIYCESIKNLNHIKINERRYKNIVNINGILTKEPNLNKSWQNIDVADFMFVNYKNDRSFYIPAVAWDKAAITVNRMKLGSPISITGRLKTREYEKIKNNEKYSRKIIELSAYKLYADTEKER